MPLLRRSREVHPISLRRSLMLLVMVCVVPSFALSTFNAYDSYRLYKQQIYSETQRIAEALIAEVDREFAGIESGLKVLATSEALRHGDLGRFHKIAKEAVKSQIVYNYILTDPNAHQVINTLVRYGEPLPKTGTPPQLASVFKEGRTVLTDYFIGPVTGKPAIAMGVPVRDENNAIKYSLNIGLAPDKLTQLLKSQPLEDGWLAALIDTSGTIVSRTTRENEFIGHKTVPDLLANIKANHNGTMETLTKGGRPVVTAYASSKTRGWSVAVGAPKQLLEAQLKDAFLYLAITMGGILLVAAWIAITIFRHLTYSVEALNEAALAINNGKPVDLPRIQLIEAGAIGRAIVQASKLSSEVHYKAYHDTLTDLANRPLFYEFLDNSLARAQRSGEPFSLLLIDLDHFKEVNDHAGHQAGDAVLKSSAQRIRAEIRAEDLAARLGGDEFAVLLVNSDRESAMDIARRVNVSLAMPYTGCNVQITASIGVVVWSDEVKDGLAMLELADRALYQVKDQGRNAVLEASV
jgi:diguanylate cyclase (GGDEF)-like protein